MEERMEALSDIANTVESPKSVCFSIENPVEASLLLETVRKAAEQNGGISVIAKKSGVSREPLYRALSSNGNPTVKTLITVFHALGMRLSVAYIGSESTDDEKK